MDFWVFLCRLNHLQIQLKLERECEDITIKCPCAEAYRKKDGHSKFYNIHKPHSVTKEEILEIVQNALAMAKKIIEDSERQICCNQKIVGIILPFICEEDVPDDSDEGVDGNIEDTLQEANLGVEPEDVSSEVIQLTEAKLINEELKIICI